MRTHPRPWFWPDKKVDDPPLRLIVRCPKTRLGRFQDLTEASAWLGNTIDGQMTASVARVVRDQRDGDVVSALVAKGITSTACALA